MWRCTEAWGAGELKRVRKAVRWAVCGSEGGGEEGNWAARVCENHEEWVGSFQMPNERCT